MRRARDERNVIILCAIPVEMEAVKRHLENLSLAFSVAKDVDRPFSYDGVLDKDKLVGEDNQTPASILKIKETFYLKTLITHNKIIKSMFTYIDETVSIILLKNH